MRTRALVAAALAGGLLLGPATVEARIDVNVNIGPPVVVAPPPAPVVVAPPAVVVAPPPVVVATPPSLVVVPGSRVYYAPDVSVNLFSYGGRYYSFHEGAWFVSRGHGAPWAAIAVGAVPGPVLAVPVTYYRVPPPGRGPAHCPPGHARRGRC